MLLTISRLANYLVIVVNFHAVVFIYLCIFFAAWNILQQLSVLVPSVSSALKETQSALVKTEVENK